MFSETRKIGRVCRRGPGSDGIIWTRLTVRQRVMRDTATHTRHIHDTYTLLGEHPETPASHGLYAARDTNHTQPYTGIISSTTHGPYSASDTNHTQHHTRTIPNITHGPYPAPQTDHAKHQPRTKPNTTHGPCPVPHADHTKHHTRTKHNNTHGS